MQANLETIDSRSRFLQRTQNAGLSTEVPTNLIIPCVTGFLQLLLVTVERTRDTMEINQYWRLPEFHLVSFHRVSGRVCQGSRRRQIMNVQADIQ